MDNLFNVKLCNTFQGLRNALRSKPRPTRRSMNDDSLEMRALGTAASVGSTGNVGSKGVLRRMPRVESDENHHAEVLFYTKLHKLVM